MTVLKQDLVLQVISSLNGSTILSSCAYFHGDNLSFKVINSTVLNNYELFHPDIPEFGTGLKKHTEQLKLMKIYPSYQIGCHGNKCC